MAFAPATGPAPVKAVGLYTGREAAVGLQSVCHASTRESLARGGGGSNELPAAARRRSRSTRRTPAT